VEIKKKKESRELALWLGFGRSLKVLDPSCDCRGKSFRERGAFVLLRETLKNSRSMSTGINTDLKSEA
jgi:hypothetical protein